VARCAAALLRSAGAQLRSTRRRERPVVHAARLPAHRRAARAAGRHVRAHPARELRRRHAAARAGVEHVRRASRDRRDRAGGEPRTGGPRIGAAGACARLVLPRAAAARLRAFAAGGLVARGGRDPGARAASVRRARPR
jgi:hypothetical protein